MRPTSITAILVAALPLAACGIGDEVPSDDRIVGAEVPAADERQQWSDDLVTAALPANTTRVVYGQSLRGRDLVYFKIAPANANGKKMLITFALHGFEDAFDHDGYSLWEIGHEAIDYYGANEGKLDGWTLYVVPSGNPDGMYAGTNNWREGTSGAFGRCASNGQDLNRQFGSDGWRELTELRSLASAIAPNIVIDFHGWMNGVYGGTELQDYFASSWNASYSGKPSRYCYVSSTGNEDCSSASVSGTFKKYGGLGGTGYFIDWAIATKGWRGALVEFPAPDYNMNFNWDDVFDDAVGFRKVGPNAHDIMWGRTKVALNNIFLGE